MSFSAKKLLAAAVSGAVFFQSALIAPLVDAREKTPTVSAKTPDSPIIGASAELKSRLKAGSESLARSGKTSKYAKAKIRWDESAEKPSQIRGIKTRVSKNVAVDAQAVFDDLSPLYGVKTSKTAKKPKLEVSEESVSKVTKERHVRLKQTYAGLPVIGDGIVGHVDETGNLYQIDGDYVPEIKVDTVAKINAAAALEKARKANSKKPKFKTSEPELAILSEPSGQNLVWQYDASFEDPKEGLSKIRYVVNAKTGKILRSYDTVTHKIGRAHV